MLWRSCFGMSSNMGAITKQLTEQAVSECIDLIYMIESLRNGSEDS